MNPRSYILFCAGEDSGDILGSEAVAAVCSMGFSAKGAGGVRMLDAGLELLIPYENLPVSGFGDVLPRYFCFRKYFEILCKALKDPLCKAFIAIDYPGFNMRLMAEADRFSKPVFYIAVRILRTAAWPSFLKWNAKSMNVSERWPRAFATRFSKRRKSYPSRISIYEKMKFFCSQGVAWVKCAAISLSTKP